MSKEDTHTLVGAYALNALAPYERQVFADHLARCPECRDEVAGFQETAVRLGLAVAEPAPPQLKARVMERIGDIRQLPPTPSRRRRAGRARVFGHQTRLRLATGVAVAATVLAAFFGIRAGQIADRPGGDALAVAAVLDASDAQASTVPAGSGTATMIVSRSRNEMVFASSSLAPLPSGRTYQIWTIDAAGAMSSAGLVGPKSPATLLRGIGGVAKLALTVEPSGGSRLPTTSPILEVPMA